MARAHVERAAYSAYLDQRLRPFCSFDSGHSQKLSNLILLSIKKLCWNSKCKIRTASQNSFKIKCHNEKIIVASFWKGLLDLQSMDVTLIAKMYSVVEYQYCLHWIQFVSAAPHIVNGFTGILLVKPCRCSNVPVKYLHNHLAKARRIKEGCWEPLYGRVRNRQVQTCIGWQISKTSYKK